MSRRGESTRRWLCASLAGWMAGATRAAASPASKTHHVFVVTADNPHPGRTILPDSFEILVVGR